MTSPFGDSSLAIPILNCVGALLAAPKGLNEVCGVTYDANNSPVFPSAAVDQLKTLGCYCTPDHVLDFQGHLLTCITGQAPEVLDTAVAIGLLYGSACEAIVSKAECQASLPAAFPFVSSLLKGVKTGAIESIGAAACASAPKAAFNNSLTQCGIAVDLNALCPAVPIATVATTTTTDAAKTTTTAADASATYVAPVATTVAPNTVLYSGAESAVVGFVAAAIALLAL
ncbi:hypothetical protein BDR26DRAFT_901227 [Obelidium mucronatum]|nr:hypothetical protein BDR26DRAFT_901227 [Obelidium mucronatum]